MVVGSRQLLSAESQRMECTSEGCVGVEVRVTCGTLSNRVCVWSSACVHVCISWENRAVNEVSYSIKLHSRPHKIEPAVGFSGCI